MKVFFWQNIISPHQSATIYQLAQNPDVEVFLICEKQTYEFRKEMKWVIPELEKINVLIEPSFNEIDKIINDNNDKNTHHIVSGLACFEISKTVLKKALGNVIVMAEAPDQNLLQLPIRYLRDYYRAFVYGRQISKFLCIGSQAQRWFPRVCNSFCYDYFPFSYSVEGSRRDNSKSTTTDGYNVVYVGSLINRKRVDLLISAFNRAEFMSKNVSLTIIGDGPKRGQLEQLAVQNGIKNVEFKGVLEREGINNYLSKSDVLVLPSKHDGWGAVVNEALLSGCQVIVSDRCGSSDLISDDIGYIFNYPIIESLKDKLELAEKRKTYELRESIKDWYEANLGPDKLAEYLYLILNYNKGDSIPTAPWRKK